MEAQKIHKSKLIENLHKFHNFLNLFLNNTILICVCYQEEKYRIMASVFIMISGFLMQLMELCKKIKCCLI